MNSETIERAQRVLYLVGRALLGLYFIVPGITKITGFAAMSASGMLPALLTLRKVREHIGVRTPLSTVEKLIVPPSAAVVLGAQHGPVLGTAVETMAGLGHPSGIAIQGVDLVDMFDPMVWKGLVIGRILFHKDILLKKLLAHLKRL